MPNTVLDYAINTEPLPLQATQEATLTLVVSNAGQTVEISKHHADDPRR